MGWRWALQDVPMPWECCASEIPCGLFSSCSSCSSWQGKELELDLVPSTRCSASPLLHQDSIEFYLVIQCQALAPLFCTIVLREIRYSWQEMFLWGNESSGVHPAKISRVASGAAIKPGPESSYRAPHPHPHPLPCLYPIHSNFLGDLLQCGITGPLVNEAGFESDVSGRQC